MRTFISNFRSFAPFFIPVRKILILLEKRIYFFGGTMKKKCCALTIALLLGSGPAFAEDSTKKAAPAASPAKTESAITATPSPEKPHNGPRPYKPSQAMLKQEKKRGGEVYEEYATVMHAKRYRNEFTPAQWKTILLQKRVRIPFTAQEHHDILLFFVNEYSQ